MTMQQQTITPKKERFIEIDALKFVALLLILYTHSEGYIVQIPLLEWFRIGGMYTGLGLFIFLSGYGLQLSATSRIRQGKFNTIQFLKRRLIRIYPLYLIALVSYIVLFQYLNIYHSEWDFSPIKEVFVIHLLSLQTILHPYFPQIPTLWFIGMLMPFYLFFALTAQNKTLKFTLIHIAIFAALLFSNFTFNIIDTRLFLYYPIFLLGCLCSRKQLVSSKRSQYSSRVVWLLGLFTLGIYSLYQYLDFPKVSSNGIESFNQIASYVFILIYSVVSIAFLISLISRCSWLLERFQQYITPVSELLYPAYLFHRIVYALSYYFFLDGLHLSRTISTLFFPIVTLLLLAVAVLIGRFETSLINRFQAKH
jgi:peptidoglycan/LPS O-acetylase OafA/YrhL